MKSLKDFTNQNTPCNEGFFFCLFGVFDRLYFNLKILPTKPIPFIQQHSYLITVFLLLIVFSEWLAKKNIFKHPGSVLILVIGAAILSNPRIIPDSDNAPV